MTPKDTCWTVSMICVITVASPLVSEMYMLRHGVLAAECDVVMCRHVGWCMLYGGGVVEVVILLHCTCRSSPCCCHRKRYGASSPARCRYGCILPIPIGRPKRTVS